ncbi:HTH_48 domain-containing protein [Trichonephila clavata]|uniref:HTH_48 domain-containing protein n=1 Tax=Trichonephila clavata TaxID=2740835 RepID=A0A8X6FNM6_TRICU|nr:HTH_48 domain-containing protein [Trichonephila clavata]
MSKQMVRRWCRTFSDERQQVEDIPRAGRTRKNLESHKSELKTSSATFFKTESVSTMGAPTIDLDTPGTTHGGQPGTSRALP